MKQAAIQLPGEYGLIEIDRLPSLDLRHATSIKLYINQKLSALDLKITPLPNCLFFEYKSIQPYM